MLRNAISSAVAELRFAAKRRARRAARPHLPADPTAIPAQVFAEARCAFVLSTGRCGTELLTHLLATRDSLDPAHRPKPSLLYPSKLAYASGPAGAAARRDAVVAARYESVRDSYETGGEYVETNNRITFFADALADSFHRARFVHLVRNPADFVRSGLMRRYYSGGNGDEGRIVPRADDPAAAVWSAITPLQRTAWLWNATNAYIEEFKSAMDPDRVLTIRAEDLFSGPEAAYRIFRFLGIEPPPVGQLQRLLAKRFNAQVARGPDVPRPRDWPEEWRRQLIEGAPLATRYGYDH